MKQPKNIGGKFHQQDKPHEASQTGQKSQIVKIHEISAFSMC